MNALQVHDYCETINLQNDGLTDLNVMDYIGNALPYRSF